MKDTGKTLRSPLGLILLLALVIVFIFALNMLSGGAPAQSEDKQPLQPLESATEPYPPPFDTPPPPEPTQTDEPLPSPTPTPLPPFPETLSYPAAVLYAGDLWLLAPGNGPLKLTGLGDVAILFGWNHDGTLLLFGRGRWEHAEYFPASTELWVLEVNTGQYRQVIPGNAVTAAAFSPVEDMIAYTNTEELLSIINLNGEELYQLENVLIGFTWSPDGGAIAVSAIAPEMDDAEWYYTVLGIWKPYEQKFVLLSDAKDEGQAWPVWSLDGIRIMFLRISYSLEVDRQTISGIYTADTSTGEMSRLEGTDKYSTAQEVSRSPRADLVAFHSGSDIYIMDFQGNPKVVAQGDSLHWLPDGTTLFYRDLDGSGATLTMDVEAPGKYSGGDRPMTGFYIRPEYFFIPGGD